MRIAVLLMLAAFIILVHRYARMRFVIAYCIAGYVLLCCMGCTSVPVVAMPKRVGITCTLGPPVKPVTDDDLGGNCRRPPMPLTCGDLPRDGSYLLLRCTP